MNFHDNITPTITWKVPDTFSDELILPARLAYEVPKGRELRQGQFPGIAETNTSSNGCYNSDRSKGSVPLTVKFQPNSVLQMLKVREIIESFLEEANALQDTQFQIKEGIDWYRLYKFGETTSFTVMSTRHLSDQERTSLASELMSFRIKYFFLSKAQVVLQLDGVDIEVLRNLLHCSTTYLPFGQRQQSSQVSLNQVKLLQGKWYQMEVNYSPVGSMPLIPLQITMSSVITCLDDDEPIAGTELGLSLISDFSATRFECQTVVDDDNSNVAMVTFWIPRSVKSVFPRDHSLTNKDGKKIQFTLEHCGNILPRTGAPGKPPRHETKSEHWRRVGETRNPSYKNRLTVIAPASSQSASQKRRFGLLKESYVDSSDQHVSYTYAEEHYPWMLFLDPLPEIEYIDVFSTHFGHFETVCAAKGDFQKQHTVRHDHTSKQMRIMSFQLPSGRQCQINRIEGTEDSSYLTKVDALHIYPFKDCQLVVSVPPYIDYRTLLVTEAKLVVTTVWIFEPFTKSNVKSTRPEISLPKVAPSKSPGKSPAKDKPSATYGDQAKPSCHQKDVSEASLQVPAYTSVAAALPPTPLSHSIQPHQSNPSPCSVASVTESQIPPGQTLRPPPSQEGIRDTNKAASENRDKLKQSRIPKVAPTVSPTVTWTNPPGSQTLPQMERLTGNMAVDLEGIEGIEENGMVGNEDCEMPPVAPHGCVTPDSKGIHHGRNADSSQKDPLPARKSNESQQITPINSGKSRKSLSLHQDSEKGEVNRPGPNTFLSPLSDPISPFSSLPGNTTPKSERAIKHIDSDPITVTPPSQRNQKNDGTSPGTPATAPKTKIPEEKHTSETVVHNVAPPPAKPKGGRMKQSCPSSMRRDKDEPHIHAVLKRSSTLPTNDSTQICIDITGDRDGVEQNGISHSNEDGSDADTVSQTKFKSIAPFLNACEKWFPTFDPTLTETVS